MLVTAVPTPVFRQQKKCWQNHLPGGTDKSDQEHPVPKFPRTVKKTIQ
jgi:hypothetical protein